MTPVGRRRWKSWEPRAGSPASFVRVAFRMMAACPLAMATIPTTIAIRIGCNRRIVDSSSKRYRGLPPTNRKSLLALRSVGRESEAESVRFHGRRVTKVGPEVKHELIGNRFWPLRGRRLIRLWSAYFSESGHLRRSQGDARFWPAVHGHPLFPTGGKTNGQ